MIYGTALPIHTNGQGYVHEVAKKSVRLAAEFIWLRDPLRSVKANDSLETCRFFQSTIRARIKSETEYSSSKRNTIS